MQNIHFNVLFFRRFLKLLKVVFPLWNSASVLLFVSLLCLVLLEQVVVYNVGLLPSQFYLALGNKDIAAFQNTVGFALLLILSLAFILATEKYVSGVFYVSSRELITKHLHLHYFKEFNYYLLNVLDDSTDNPDQRICQDVDKTCEQFSSIIARLLISPFTIAYYTYKTWQLTGYIGPVCVVAFFIVSTIINKFLMSPVVEFVFKQEKLEGDFRFKHMQIRTNAESAAFYRCGKLELKKTNKKFDDLLQTQQTLIRKQYALNFSINIADYLGSILSYTIVAIPIFGGKYDDLSPTELSALISQVAFVTIYLISCFTRLIDMALTAADIAGTTHRIGQLLELMKNMRTDDKSESNAEFYSGLEMNSESEACAYKLQNVTYGPPGCDDQPLVKNLTLEITREKNILITGDSGCGKSSLIRILDSLWQPFCGTVRRNICHGPNGILYLPQKPMLTDGTLREQIIYPQMENDYQEPDDPQMLAYLQEADLMTLHDRTGGLDVPVDWNWYDHLSPGEMQRLSFIRLLCHRPKYAVLDEATSQVGLEMEKRLYTMCSSMNITLISIGHRESLRQFHNVELHIAGNGQWTIEQI